MEMKEINRKYIAYLNTQTESVATIKGYNNDIKMFMRWLEEWHGNCIDVECLNRKVLREYVDFLEGSGLAYKTIKRRITVLNAVLQYAYERDYILENPLWRMKIRLKNNSQLPEVLEIGEINRYLYAVHNTPVRCSKLIHIRDIAIIELLFSTGMRAAELANLKRDDWNQSKRTFKYIAKGRKQRVSFVDNPEVLTALQNYIDISMHIESEYLFLNKFEQPMSVGAVRDVVKKYSKVAHIEKRVTPHTFRRSFATLLIDSGMDISYVQKILGHSCITTTQLYVRLSEQSARKTLRGNNPRDYMSFI